MNFPDVVNMYHLDENKLGGSALESYNTFLEGISPNHPGYSPNCLLFVVAKLFSMSRQDWDRISAICINQRGLFDRHSFMVLLKIAAVQQRSLPISEENLMLNTPFPQLSMEDWNIPEDRIQIYSTIFGTVTTSDGKLTKEDVFQISKMPTFFTQNTCNDYFYLTDFDKDGKHDFFEFAAIMELIHKTLKQTQSIIQDNIPGYAVQKSKVFPLRVVFENLDRSNFDSNNYPTTLSKFIPHPVPVLGDVNCEIMTQRDVINAQNTELSRKIANIKKEIETFKEKKVEIIGKIETSAKMRDGLKLRGTELKQQIRTLELRQKDGNTLIQEKKEHLENLKKSFDKQKLHLERENCDLNQMRKITSNTGEYKEELEKIITELQKEKYVLNTELVSDRDELVRALNEHLKQRNSKYSNDRLLSLVDDFKIYKPYIDDRIGTLNEILAAFEKNQIPEITKSFVRFESNSDGIYETSMFPNIKDLNVGPM
uniref:EH domain-containing protein n=1 Tax=Rhabditophanes sp. KR3021 TaxID=114890 RepID=A0AC35U538_9BILA